eukprot:7082827-Prymnesium_polylepis.1
MSARPCTRCARCPRRRTAAGSPAHCSALVARAPSTQCVASPGGLARRSHVRLHRARTPGRPCTEPAHPIAQSHGGAWRLRAQCRKCDFDVCGECVRMASAGEWGSLPGWFKLQCEDPIDAPSAWAVPPPPRLEPRLVTLPVHLTRTRTPDAILGGLMRAASILTP